jgi:hypothetical protein
MAVTARVLSGSINGRGVKITSVTAASGTLIHTAATGTAATTFDELYLYATNLATTAKLVTLNYGGTVSGDKIPFTVPSRDGLYTLVQGLRLNGGVVVRAYAASACTVGVHGIANRNS